MTFLRAALAVLIVLVVPACQRLGSETAATPSKAVTTMATKEPSTGRTRDEEEAQRYRRARPTSSPTAPTTVTDPAPDPCTLVPKQVLGQVVPGAAPIPLPALSGEAKSQCRWIATVADTPRVRARILTVTLSTPLAGVEPALAELRSSGAEESARPEPGLGGGAFGVSWTDTSYANAAVAFGRGSVMVDVALGAWRQGDIEVAGRMEAAGIRQADSQAGLLPGARKIARAVYGQVPDRPVQIAAPNPDLEPASKLASSRLPAVGCEFLSTTTQRALVPRADIDRGSAKGDIRYCTPSTPLDGRFGPTRAIRIVVEKFDSEALARLDYQKYAWAHAANSMNNVTHSGALDGLGDESLVVAGTARLESNAKTEAYALIRRGAVVIKIEYSGRVTRGLGIPPTLLPTKEMYAGVVKVAREYVGHM